MREAKYLTENRTGDPKTTSQIFSGSRIADDWREDNRSSIIDLVLTQIFQEDENSWEMVLLDNIVRDQLFLTAFLNVEWTDVAPLNIV